MHLEDRSVGKGVISEVDRLHEHVEFNIYSSIKPGPNIIQKTQGCRDYIIMPYSTSNTVSWLIHYPKNTGQTYTKSTECRICDVFSSTQIGPCQKDEYSDTFVLDIELYNSPIFCIFCIWWCIRRINRNLRGRDLRFIMS